MAWYFDYMVGILFSYRHCLLQLEKAYDRIMFAQLSNRKKGVTFGSFQVFIIALAELFLSSVYCNDKPLVATRGEFG